MLHLANNSNILSIRACYTMRDAHLCRHIYSNNAAECQRRTLRRRTLSIDSRILFFSPFQSVLVTNNRSSGIYFITTHVSMPARRYTVLPNPVIIAYHLFLLANAGIGAAQLQGESSTEGGTSYHGTSRQ